MALQSCARKTFFHQDLLTSQLNRGPTRFNTVTKKENMIWSSENVALLERQHAHNSAITKNNPDA